MSVMTLLKFRQGLRALDGSVLETLYRAQRFAVRVLPDGSGVEYTPLSTGKSRTQSWDYVDRVLDLYNSTHSLHPGEYKDVTNHASYTLTIVDRLRRIDSRDEVGRT